MLTVACRCCSTVFSWFFTDHARQSFLRVGRSAISLVLGVGHPLRDVCFALLRRFDAPQAKGAILGTTWGTRIRCVLSSALNFLRVIQIFTGKIVASFILHPDHGVVFEDVVGVSEAPEKQSRAAISLLNLVAKVYLRA